MSLSSRICSLGLKHFAPQKHWNLRAKPASCMYIRLRVFFHLFLVNKWLNRIAPDSCFRLTGEIALQKIHRCFPHTCGLCSWEENWGLSLLKLSLGLIIIWRFKKICHSLFWCCFMWLLLLESETLSLCLWKELSLWISEFLVNQFV